MAQFDWFAISGYWAISSGGFSKLGAQCEDMYGAHLIRSFKENGEKKITD